MKVIEMSDKLLEATLRMDGGEVARLLEYIHGLVVAPDFYNNEQALRSVIKVAYLSSVDDFITIQELPSGKGYADLVFLPQKGVNRPAMVVELKWDKTVEGAIQQIRDRKYPQVIQNYGGDILLVGINYDSKDKKHVCHIERFE